jgi:hypothetical protein
MNETAPPTLMRLVIVGGISTTHEQFSNIVSEIIIGINIDFVQCIFNTEDMPMLLLSFILF